MNKYLYSGIVIRSNVPFPQMTPENDSGAVDLDIDVRMVGTRNWLEPVNGVVRPYVEKLAATEVILEHPVHGRMTMTPTKITVEVEDSAHWELARTYVLGTALAICAYMKGWTPFHMSAVLVGANAVAFAGESFAGKSTWAALTILGAGGALLCDDVARIGKASEKGGRIIWPSLTRLRFRDDLRTVLTKSGVDKILEDSQGRLECYGFRVAEGPCRLRGVFLPAASEDGQFSVNKVDASTAVLSAFDNVFRREYGMKIIGAAEVMRAALELAADIPFYELRYPLGIAHAEENSSRFCDVLRDLIGIN